MGLFGNLFGKKKSKRTFKFEIGDKVICIDDRNHKVIFGKTYTILNRLQLSCCGTFCYDVGLQSTNGHTQCGDCNKDIQGKEIHWCGEFRFAPKVGDTAEAEKEEEVESMTDALDKILEEAREEYEKEHALN